MPKLQLPEHVQLVRSRGREYFYFHRFRGTPRQEPRISLPGCPQNPDGTLNHVWWDAYYKAAGIETAPKGGTVSALIAAYTKSMKWNGHAQSTHVNWTRYFAYIEKVWGDLPVRAIERTHVNMLRDQYAASPGKPSQKRRRSRDRKPSANNLLRALSAMLAWAADNGWRADNPALRVEKFKEANDREAWPQEMIDLVRDHGPPWMWQAVALALYSAQRQGDCLRMRWDWIDKQGRITVRPKKTQKAGVKKLEIMIHPELRKVLDTIPRSSVRILNDARGVPWRSSFAFRASWRKALKGPLTAIAESKLVFHSLRRTAVEQMLLSGNSHQHVQSITAQTYATIERYAANMRRTELGDAAIERWDQHGRQKR